MIRSLVQITKTIHSSCGLVPVGTSEHLGVNESVSEVKNRLGQAEPGAAILDGSSLNWIIASRQKTGIRNGGLFIGIPSPLRTNAPAS